MIVERCIIFIGNNNYQDEAVEKVVEFMDFYSISQEDFDTVVEISKFKVSQAQCGRLCFSKLFLDSLLM